MEKYRFYIYLYYNIRVTRLLSINLLETQLRLKSSMLLSFKIKLWYLNGPHKNKKAFASSSAEYINHYQCIVITTKAMGMFMF